MTAAVPVARPPGRPAIRMRWSTLLFLHWPVPETSLRPIVPAPLELDTCEGVAWVGLIPFTMPAFRPAGLPPVPTMRRFHECNVRTYVRVGAERGVYFFSLDATSRLAVWVARTFWRLNYRFARIELRAGGGTVDYALDRPGRGSVPAARLRCSWRPGAARPASRPGDLDHFLTERYALFTTDRRGRPRRGRIWHEPWPLREADLLDLEDGLVPAAGIGAPDEPPVVFCADSLDVLAWPLGRC